MRSEVNETPCECRARKAYHGPPRLHQRWTRSGRRRA